ncbi:MAG: metal-sensitive transcriptional regulator, partial [Acidobacteriota bacterium]|nr:metal-sensitive transcriptional regulator [Acidobacteriota bacterium]
MAGSVKSVAPEEHKRLLDRLARVEGQLRGIQKMIHQEAECEAIAQQLAAARGALN